MLRFGEVPLDVWKVLRPSPRSLMLTFSCCAVAQLPIPNLQAPKDQAWGSAFGGAWGILDIIDFGGLR